MTAPATSSHAESFLRYFSVRLANTEEEKSDCFRIRYRVYCEEFGYEPVDAFENKMETDIFDDQSLHCLITHRATNAPAGCVRVVKSRPQTADGLLPFEKYCKDSLDLGYLGQEPMSRNTVCEVSRLAVDCIFRRRSGEQATRFGGSQLDDISKAERRAFPLIAVSCFLAATALTDLEKRTNAFAMMEPFLPRILARSGIDFTKVGKNVDYHGTRAAYFITTESAVSNMSQDLKELYHAIHGVIAEDFNKAD